MCKCKKLDDLFSIRLFVCFIVFFFRIIVSVYFSFYFFSFFFGLVQFLAAKTPSLLTMQSFLHYICIHQLFFALFDTPPILRYVCALKLLHYNDESLQSTFHKLTSLDIFHTYFDTEIALTAKDLSTTNIIHIGSTNSIIFNENILNNEDMPKYIEISYSNASTSLSRQFVNQRAILELRDLTSFTWTPLGDCVTNFAGDKATYKQSWSLELDVGFDFRLGISEFFINAAPGVKNEFLVGKGVGGSYSCDLKPGKTLQFVIMYQRYMINGVKHRSVQKSTRNKVVYGDWKLFDAYEQIARNEIQIACITNPKYLQCSSI